ncbi:MAG: hypothetical protein ABIQ30_17900 [Devosia sp.]
MSGIIIIGILPMGFISIFIGAIGGAIAGIAAIGIISPGLPWKIILSQASPSILSMAKALGTIIREAAAAAIAIESRRI